MQLHVLCNLCQPAGSGLAAILNLGMRSMVASGKACSAPCHGTQGISHLSIICQEHYRIPVPVQVSMRDPIDRATSCLFFFHRDAMNEVLQMTEEEFQKVALEDTACNNMAAGMLMSDLPGIDSMAVNKASLNASLSEAITASALTNLERCIVINHLDVSHGQVWSTWAHLFLTTWFPWATVNSTALPHKQINHMPYRLPYRLVKVLEELNSVDMLLYERSAELMLLQLGFAMP